MSTALVPVNPQQTAPEPIDHRLYLPSETDILRDEWLRKKARKLNPLELRWYKFLAFWGIGNMRVINQALYLHDRAVDIDQKDKQLYRMLLPEYKFYGRLLEQHLSYLGFSNVEQTQGRRRFKQRIKFLRGVVTPEQFYYQVWTSKRTATGAKTMLPYKVNAGDLLDDKTITHLSIALNRRVTAEYRSHKGLWFIVHTTEDMGALPRRVSFWSMEDHMNHGKQELLLGVGANRTVHVIDLDKRPHLLLAGSTGGGKSNSLNAMICMLIRMNEPESMRLILIDLKNGVEFEDYEDIPHLATDVITSQRAARDILIQALALIKIRYGKMRRLPKPRPKSLTAYNARVDSGLRMPRLIIAVDELGELLIGGNEKLQKEIERLLIRIAQLGRAAGVHLILSTQRPQKEIVTTAISAQMTVKMSHIMGTKSDSLTIFGSGEAAELDPIPGRAVYKYGWEAFVGQPPEATPEVIGASTAKAKSMMPAPFELPDLEYAESLVMDDTDTGPDYEGQLIMMLVEAGGNLSLQLIMEVLGMTRPQAQLWLARVADITFEFDDKVYHTVQIGRSYRIEEYLPPGEEDTQPEIEAPAKPEKWRVKR